jgi:hypothetical protein
VLIVYTIFKCLPNPPGQADGQPTSPAMALISICAYCLHVLRGNLEPHPPGILDFARAVGLVITPSINTISL